MVQVAHGGSQALRPASALGVDEGRPQDVGQRLHEPVDLVVEAARLPLLRRTPGVHDEAGRNVAIAVDDLAVDLQLGAHVGEDLLDAVVTVTVTGEARHGLLPEVGEHAPRSVADERAQLALETKHLPAQSLALETAWCKLLQDAVDGRRQRAHERTVARSLDEDDRVVVPEPRQVTVAGEECRPERRSVDRVELVTRPASGQVEDDLSLDGCGGPRLPRLLRQWICGHATACSSVPSSGQTVNVSNSASRPARMRSAGRAWPAPRSSS